MELMLKNNDLLLIFKSIPQSNHIDPQLFLEKVQKLLAENSGFKVDFENEGLLYLHHVLGKSAISSNTPPGFVDTQVRPRVLYYPDGKDMEGWNHKAFLSMRLYFLLDFYIARFIAPKSKKISESINKKEFEKFLEDEIWITANAYRVSSALESVTEELMKEIVDEFVKFLSTTDFSKGAELCYPCGTKDHAAYLSFISYEDEIVIRMDNFAKSDDSIAGHSIKTVFLGSGQPQDHLQPKTLFAIKKSEIGSHHDKLVDYLMKVSKAKKEESLEASKVAYKVEGFTKVSLEDETWDYQSSLQVGNCVSYNYQASVWFRANRCGKTVYQHMRKKELVFIARHLSPKEGLQEKYDNMEMAKKVMLITSVGPDFSSTYYPIEEIMLLLSGNYFGLGNAEVWGVLASRNWGEEEIQAVIGKLRFIQEKLATSPSAIILPINLGDSNVDFWALLHLALNNKKELIRAVYYDFLKKPTTANVKEFQTAIQKLLDRNSLRIETPLNEENIKDYDSGPKLVEVVRGFINPNSTKQFRTLKDARKDQYEYLCGQSEQFRASQGEKSFSIQNDSERSLFEKLKKRKIGSIIGTDFKVASDLHLSNKDFDEFFGAVDDIFYLIISNISNNFLLKEENKRFLESKLKTELNSRSYNITDDGKKSAILKTLLLREIIRKEKNSGEEDEYVVVDSTQEMVLDKLEKIDVTDKLREELRQFITEPYPGFQIKSLPKKQELLAKYGVRIIDQNFFDKLHTSYKESLHFFKPIIQRRFSATLDFSHDRLAVPSISEALISDFNGDSIISVSDKYMVFGSDSIIQIWSWEKNKIIFFRNLSIKSSDIRSVFLLSSDQLVIAAKNKILLLNLRFEDKNEVVVLETANAVIKKTIILNNLERKNDVYFCRLIVQMSTRNQETLIQLLKLVFLNENTYEKVDVEDLIRTEELIKDITLSLDSNFLLIAKESEIQKYDFLSHKPGIIELNSEEPLFFLSDDLLISRSDRGKFSLFQIDFDTKKFLRYLDGKPKIGSIVPFSQANSLVSYTVTSNTTSQIILYEKAKSKGFVQVEASNRIDSLVNTPYCLLSRSGRSITLWQHDSRSLKFEDFVQDFRNITSYLCPNLTTFIFSNILVSSDSLQIIIEVIGRLENIIHVEVKNSNLNNQDINKIKTIRPSIIVIP